MSQGQDNLLEKLCGTKIFLPMMGGFKVGGINIPYELKKQQGDIYLRDILVTTEGHCMINGYMRVDYHTMTISSYKPTAKELGSIGKAFEKFRGMINYRGLIQVNGGPTVINQIPYNLMRDICYRLEVNGFADSNIII